MGKFDDLITAVGRAAPPPKYIRAYHASPYDFERFDFAGNMGRGEGAQAFAHGGYFAGDEKVGEFYRRAFSNRPQPWTPERFANNVLLMIPQRDAAIEHIEQSIRSATSGIPFPRETPVDFMQRAAEYLRGVSADFAPPSRPRANLYEVDIAHPERALLDWDSTLEKQQHLLPQVERAIKTIPDRAARHDSMIAIEEPHSFRGSEVHALLRNSLGGEPAAARSLLDAGVPGVRYLDGNSRRVGEGSRNTVMFPGTEDSIRILRKYGLLAPMAAGAMGEQE
jgi:hypothetical protein